MILRGRWIWSLFILAAFGITVAKRIVSAGRGADLEWVLDLAAALTAAWVVRWGFRQLRKKNMIENVASSPIRSVAMGLAEIKGQAAAGAPLAAPLSNTPCVYYRYLVEEERRRSKGGREWVTIDQGVSEVPFHVQDPTGRILINPEGADVLLGRDFQAIERGSGWLARRTRRSEWRIHPGDFLYLIGTVAKLRDMVAERRTRLQEKLQGLKRDREAISRFDLDGDERIDAQEWAGAVAVAKHDLLREEVSRQASNPQDDLFVGRGALEDTFVISDRDERSVAASLGWKAFGAVLGGGAGVLLMAVSLLGRFGLLPGRWTFPWESLFS